MGKKKLSLLMGVLLASSGLTVDAQQLAFPGAEGWGRFATGGRGGSVYHVTNLKDSGAGSLRDAVSQANRIVVFDVAGVIKLESRLVFAKNLYVAGQTAPGEGITVYGNGVSFSGATNTIVRYMRFRMGKNGDSGKDAAGIANGTNMIFDHCSVSWGRDETFSISPDGKGDLHSITIQNSIIGQGLLTHSAGGLIQADSITLYRNLYVDNSTRNNKVKGRSQFVNNIVYNWSNGAYIMGGDSEGQSYCNIEGNLFMNGPSKGGDAFTGGNENFHFYGNDNWQDSDRDGTFDPSEVTKYSASDRQSKPYPYPEMEKWAGNELIEKSIPAVGASLPYRDYADCYMIDEVMSFGKKGALISNEETLIYGAPTTWTVWGGNKRVDSDNDGMPDAWETANGTDPNKNDAMVKAANGYVNIENYINSITIDDRDYFLRAPISVELASATTTTLKVQWRDYTDNEDGFVVEIDKGAGFVEAGKVAAGATSFTITGLEAATKYPIRMRSFAGEKYSDYTAVVEMSTRPIEVGIVDIDTYQPDYTWGTAVTAWDFTNNGWNNGTAVYTDAKKVLFAPEADATVTLNETVAPEAVVVNSDANLTISGTGAISGETTSVNKAGEGTLVLGTNNTYKGATVLHGGVLEFNSLKNGGVASSLGASVGYSQDWIFDGGTYRYTGGTTSTDREAKILSETEFNIAKSGTIVTVNNKFEGNGSLVINGEGQLTVGSTKFFGYNGATVLKGGTVYLSTTDITKAGIGSSSKLVMAGGHLKTAGETEGYETYSFPIELAEGTTSQLSPNRNCYLNNKLTGAGTLQLNIPYLREYIGFNSSGFTGRLIANGVSSDKNGSLLLLNKGKTSHSTFTIDLKNNARLCAWDTSPTVEIGGISGESGTYIMGSSKNTKNFTCTWKVGYANTNETFKGKINNWSCSGSGYTGTVNITKVGTGDWRLTGSNDYKGTTSIAGGRLIVNGTNSGTGQVIVAADATLAGKGTVAGKVTVMADATVYAGDTLINSQTLKLTGGCTINEGGAVEVPLYSSNGATKCNRLQVTGNFQINGATLRLNMSETEGIKNDASFYIFNLSGATVKGSGFTTIEPARPSATQVWDTSKLLTLGIIYVRADETLGVGEIEAEKDSDAPVYDLGGRKVANPSKGFYIKNGKKYLMK